MVSSANSSFLFNLSSHGESYSVYMEDRGLLGRLLPCHNASCEETPAMLATSRDAQSEAIEVESRGRGGGLLPDGCLLLHKVLERKQTM